ncbi:MAG: SDR family NAD(P)-dependent oxidoreductase, partial [Bacteroidetes bacterium]|nr:SDR family NAD(P)-dependent oxidoreductase [Bacteroidota bacterium]
MLKEDALKGKSILITGGGTGLGKSMGKYFLQLGANLIISSRKKEVLERTAEELRSETGGEVLPVVCDVRNFDQVSSVISSAEDAFGALNVVINNAAG